MFDEFNPLSLTYVSNGDDKIILRILTNKNNWDIELSLSLFHIHSFCILKLPRNAYSELLEGKYVCLKSEIFFDKWIFKLIDQHKYHDQFANYS